jgi:type III pantothenate kinase
MLLVIDVGNTNTVLGLFDGDRLRASWRVFTQNYRTSDELRILLGLLLQQEGANLESINGCCISSVVPQLNMALMRVSQSMLKIEPVMVGPGIKTGLILQYDNPKEVGADRIVNSVAALEEYGGPLVIVDFGTATTLDVVSAKGEYKGGVILPGLQVSADVLSERCAKLPRVEVSRPASAIGRNTVDSIRSGLTYGYAELIDGLIERISQEMDTQFKVIATGGLSQAIAAIAKSIQHVDPLLTLKGLKAIYRKNERGSA